MQIIACHTQCILNLILHTNVNFTLLILPCYSSDVTRSHNIKVELLTSRTKTKIPVVVLRHPNAKYTILYSHGNATDCGAMLPMYKMIAEFLKVNVVGTLLILLWCMVVYILSA